MERNDRFWEIAEEVINSASSSNFYVIPTPPTDLKYKGIDRIICDDVILLFVNEGIATRYKGEYNIQLTEKGKLLHRNQNLKEYFEKKDKIQKAQEKLPLLQVEEIKRNRIITIISIAISAIIGTASLIFQINSKSEINSLRNEVEELKAEKQGISMEQKQRVEELPC